jgi:hypothetical protein
MKWMATFIALLNETTSSDKPSHQRVLDWEGLFFSGVVIVPPLSSPSRDAKNAHRRHVGASCHLLASPPRRIEIKFLLSRSSSFFIITYILLVGGREVDRVGGGGVVGGGTGGRWVSTYGGFVCFYEGDSQIN